MSLLFHELVEEIKHRPIEEMAELRELLDHELVRAGREKIYESHLEGMKEWESGRLTPTSDVDEIMRRLDSE